MKTSIIQQHYDLLRLVVDHGAYPVLVVDQNNIVQITNPAADRFLQVPADDLVGRRFPYELDGMRTPTTKVIHAEDGSWTAELHVELANLRGNKIYICSLRDLADRKLLHHVMERTSLVDSLTGLLSEEGFLLMVEQQLKHSSRTGKDFLLLVVDIDDMHHINDAHSMESGNMALQELASIIKDTFRESDIVARTGGDEFMLAALDAHPDSGGILAARLRDALWERNASTQRPYPLSLTSGVVLYDSTVFCGAEELVQKGREVLALSLIHI